MMKHGKWIIPLMMLAAILSATSLTSCSKKVQPTSIIVLDSIRHYYTLLQGQELVMDWRIANIGKDPLVITDIQPSCGCISNDINDDDSYVVLPNKEGRLKFTFHSDKYTGYVHHTIRLFGNIAPHGIATLIFDIHVVPPYLGSPDYEQFYHDNAERDAAIKGLINGHENQRGYFTDDKDGDSHNYNRFPWKEEETKINANRY